MSVKFIVNFSYSFLEKCFVYLLKYFVVFLGCVFEVNVFLVGVEFKFMSMVLFR